ncbi:MAG: DUF1501 domain-containing protein, partial [Burkholderiales bacterium]|nr:DUF1501 domain-containing protein [Burkholderiales bacterium]
MSQSNPPVSDASRRAFLQRASSLALAGTAAPLALNLAALGEAAAATSSDYKALVCVFLYGGNDYANTLIPYDADNYNRYTTLRPTLAYARSALTDSVLVPSVAPVDGGGFARQYALAPELSALKPLFDAGRMALLLNIGTLYAPTTKAQYSAKTVPLPPKLFSHNDQQSVWQASAAEGAISGWGGRIGDLMMAGNGTSTFTCINVSSNAVFLSGRNAVQYQVGSGGPVAINGVRNALFGSTIASATLKSLITQSRGHLMEAEHNRVTQRTIDAYDALNNALAAAPVFSTVFPTGNTLADQLKLVARMIGSATLLSARRQVFFVSLGGFDTHDSVLSVHPGLLTKVGQALAAFDGAMQELGVGKQVTAFTAS